ncbi:MAG: Holo-[acyl-carrier-protein] synthase [Candidatus Anoxychlamydiales bacterium]|nr:Holo-[acyl-carrier-protein] synthase [Candidatus Anoxychlamydiales bacterium]
MAMMTKAKNNMKKSRMTNIKGIGTDIIEIERLRLVIKRKGQPFLEKIFTEVERKYCIKFKDSTLHYAARFSAKEAIAKALGTGFGKDLSFLDIEITNDEKGKPLVNLSKAAEKRFNRPKILISISHTDTLAIAFVMIS